LQLQDRIPPAVLAEIEEVKRNILTGKIDIPQGF
jgi:hypothetical protein